jgi:hypothetical protein
MGVLDDGPTRRAEQRGMMRHMQPDLRYLVHFFNDERFLFKTITMAGASRADDICNVITANKGWHWIRFAPSERHDYLKRRRFVEEAMYQDFTREHGDLKETVPIYFYLIPNITERTAIELAQQRTRHDEAEPRVVMVKTQDIDDTRNVTFTLNDSHNAYRKRIIDAGLKFGGHTDVPVALPDHDKVFPFSMIEQLHHDYAARQIRYEIQVWDHQLPEKMPYELLGKEGP